MPAQPIFFDIVLRKFTEPSGVDISSFTAKRGDRRKYELGLLNNRAPSDVPSSSVLRLTIKDPANLTASTPLATAVGSKSGFAGFSRWIFDLDLNTSELTSRMGTASAPVTLSSELEIILPDGVISSLTVPFVVENDAQRGSEGAPTPAINGWANVMGVVVHGATAGTARPLQFTVVTWIGSVEPTNMIDNDIWEDTSP